MLSYFLFFIFNSAFFLIVLLLYPLFCKFKESLKDELPEVDKPYDDSNDENKNPLTPYRSIIEMIYALLTFKNYFLSFLALFLFRSFEYLIYRSDIDFITLFIYVCIIQLFFVLIWKKAYGNYKRSNNTENRNAFNINKFYSDLTPFIDNVKRFILNFKALQVSVILQIFLTGILFFNFHFYSKLYQYNSINLVVTEAIFLLPSILCYKKIRQFFIPNSEKSSSDMLFVPIYFSIIMLLIFLTYKISDHVVSFCLLMISKYYPNLLVPDEE